VVICVGSDHLRAHVGAAWRAVADGGIIRVSDRRSGEILGWLMRRTRTRWPAGSTCCRTRARRPTTWPPWTSGPSCPPEPSAWVVPQVPEPAAEVA